VTGGVDVLIIPFPIPPKPDHGPEAFETLNPVSWVPALTGGGLNVTALDPTEFDVPAVLGVDPPVAEPAALPETVDGTLEGDKG
jgi:hypothetical protein